MVTMLATPNKTAIYANGAGDAPFSDPINNLGLIKFDSTFGYLPFVPARTITASVSVPSSADFRRTIVLGPHGQAGVPFIYGLVSGIPFVGTIPVHVASSARTAIFWTLCVDANNVFIAEQRANPLTFSAVTSPRTVTVYISSKLAA